ncbi:MAG: PASTA domain-containing protein [Actinomycetota bacterium]
MQQTTPAATQQSATQRLGGKAAWAMAGGGGAYAALGTVGRLAGTAADLAPWCLIIAAALVCAAGVVLYYWSEADGATLDDRRVYLTVVLLIAAVLALLLCGRSEPPAPPDPTAAPTTEPAAPTTSSSSPSSSSPSSSNTTETTDTPPTTGEPPTTEDEPAPDPDPEELVIPRALTDLDSFRAALPGVTLVVAHRPVANVPKGSVATTDPPPQTTVAPGDTVAVVVSSGSLPDPMRDIIARRSFVIATPLSGNLAAVGSALTADPEGGPLDVVRRLLAKLGLAEGASTIEIVLKDETTPFSFWEDVDAYFGVGAQGFSYPITTNDGPQASLVFFDDPAWVELLEANLAEVQADLNRGIDPAG